MNEPNCVVSHKLHEYGKDEIRVIPFNPCCSTLMVSAQSFKYLVWILIISELPTYWPELLMDVGLFDQRNTCHGASTTG